MRLHTEAASQNTPLLISVVLHVSPGMNVPEMEVIFGILAAQHLDVELVAGKRASQTKNDSDGRRNKKRYVVRTRRHVLPVATNSMSGNLSPVFVPVSAGKAGLTRRVKRGTKGTYIDRGASSTQLLLIGDSPSSTSSDGNGARIMSGN